MATYTTELRTLIEQPTQHLDNLTLDQRIEVGRVMLFDFDYPIFDERYKRVFETNFIRHFYYREIGFETEFLFKQRLQNWLNLNMGYFNKLFDSEMMKFDPFINSKVDVTHTRKNDRDTINDTIYGETTSRDIDETVDTDEDTSKDIEQNVSGDTSDNTDYTGNKDIEKDGSTRLETDFTNQRDTDKDGSTDDTTDHTVTTNTDTDRSVDTSGSTDGRSTGESDVREDSNETQNTDSSTDTERFSRNLHTDTPDTRLAISTNEGEGLIEYASDITENKESEDQNVDSNTTTNRDTDTHTSSTDTTQSESSENQNTIENVNEEETGNKTESGSYSEDVSETESSNKVETGTSSEDTGELETYTKDETGTSNEDTSIGETGTRDEVVERVLNELGKRDYDQNVKGNIKDLENYIEHRTGKIGIQTYSKMLQEFRQTFLRVEVQAFREMESRLFMLVY